MWELDHKAECQRTDPFELWCWRRLLRVPWTARRSNQSILKEISPEYSLEGLMLKLKLQYFGHLMWRTDSSEKTLMLGKIEGRRRRGQQRVRWLDGITDSMDIEFEQAVGVGDGQGGLACCSSWDRKESDPTEQLNWTELLADSQHQLPAMWDPLTPALSSLPVTAAPTSIWLQMHERPRARATQWLPWWFSGKSILLPMQETWVQTLIWEDHTCHGATKPMHHSYGAGALEPWEPQPLKPVHPRTSALQQEKPRQWEACTLPLESSPACCDYRKDWAATKTLHSQ